MAFFFLPFFWSKKKIIQFPLYGNDTINKKLRNIKKNSQTKNIFILIDIFLLFQFPPFYLYGLCMSVNFKDKSFALFNIILKTDFLGKTKLKTKISYIRKTNNNKKDIKSRTL